MFVKVNILAVNPFFDAYTGSDLLGKMIFLGLLLLSVATWVILVYKIGMTGKAKNNSLRFGTLLKESKGNILNLEYDEPDNFFLHPFCHLYQVLKTGTLDLLNKNRRFGKALTEENTAKASYLSHSDIDIIRSHLSTTISLQIKQQEKNLFILSTIVTLAPFLGLLGTVWGILVTFSELQTQTGGNTNQMVIGGLSLALATTVFGLIDAIPALIGYNYLKSVIKDFHTEMECFSNEILASVEMQYRKVDVE